MSRVLVTGADGFTGRYMIPLLLEAGHEVIGMTRGAAPPPDARSADMLIGDICDPDAMKAVVKASRPDRVLHLAAIAFVGHGSPRAFYDVNILGTRALLEACAALDSLEQVVLASSAQIYGMVEGIVAEDQPPQPANDYAVSKLAMEHVARLYAPRLPITIARPFNYTGVGQPNQFLIPKIIDHMRRRAPVMELGNLDVERDFSDVRTTAEVYRRLLDRPGTPGTVDLVNICSGEGHRLEDIVAIARAATGHDIAVRVNPAFVRANEVRSLIGSRAALDRMVGPIARPSITDTIRWMLEGEQNTSS